MEAIAVDDLASRLIKDSETLLHLIISTDEGEKYSHKGERKITRNTRILLVFLFVLLTSFISCSLDFTLRITGKVTDATDNSPIYEASVRLMKMGWDVFDTVVYKEVKTDLQGRYSITYSGSGRCRENFSITVEKDEGLHEKKYSGLRQDVRCTENIQTFNFRLEPHIFIKD